MANVRFDRAFALGLLGLVGVFGASACIRTTFVRTEATFAGVKADVEPVIYIDRLPERGYRSVGIIEVIAGDEVDLGRVLDAVKKKGREIGCDLVMDRSLHVAVPEGRADLDSVDDRPRWSQVNLVLPPPMPPRPVTAPQTTGAHTREFVCGIFVPAPSVERPPSDMG